MALLQLRWGGLLPLGLSLELSIGPGFLLLGLTASVAGTEAGAEEVPEGFEVTSSAADVKRAVRRSCAGATTRPAVLERLRRCCSAWRHSRGSAAILQLAERSAAAAAAGAQGAPGALGGRLPAAAPESLRTRLFLERAGCQTARLSWEVLSGEAEADAAKWEIELLTLQRSTHNTGDEVGLRSLGCTLVPGGLSVREFVFRRLRPLTWHHARLRAVGPGRRWASVWSDELSFKTTSLEEAKAAGRQFDANSVLVPSELRLLAAVAARTAGSDASTQSAEEENDDDGDEDVEEEEEDDDGEEMDLSPEASGLDTGSSMLAPFSESEASIWSSRIMPQVLEAAVGGSLDADTALVELLRARKYQDGCRSFVNGGMKYSQPSSTRDMRLRRAKLVLASKLLYDPNLTEGNPWFMGPFYYGDGPHAAKVETGF
eukprot:CAMPEP_0206468244 /NCGR_PEP_ID=MMETSP0324_2-20121206/29499_1 /ASSEMBLY_ACC=CAM_ASM_000836 /TAXON_ID=2866 /ORGANISM="Crypthecodinium cohnii, Strain Seligo" /LENGTH=429 /DNA_ID=CAMNT_0053941635 /DNA_START=21 /DNA_END=1310 /DNA_ORIENTATION=-